MLGGGEQFAQRIDIVRGGRGLDRLDPRRIGDVGGVVEHVLGQRDHHRAGASLHRDAERARDDFRDARGVVDLDHPLGQRAERRAVIEFLERFAVAHAALDLADEQDHRRRILHRDVQPRDWRWSRPARA